MGGVKLRPLCHRLYVRASGSKKVLSLMTTWESKLGWWLCWLFVRLVDWIDGLACLLLGGSAGSIGWWSAGWRAKPCWFVHPSQHASGLLLNFTFFANISQDLFSFCAWQRDLGPSVWNCKALCFSWALCFPNTRRGEGLIEKFLLSSDLDSRFWAYFDLCEQNKSSGSLCFACYFEM